LNTVARPINHIDGDQYCRTRIKAVGEFVGRLHVRAGWLTLLGVRDRRRRALARLDRGWDAPHWRRDSESRERQTDPPRAAERSCTRRLPLRRSVSARAQTHPNQHHMRRSDASYSALGWGRQRSFLTIATMRW